MSEGYISGWSRLTINHPLAYKGAGIRSLVEHEKLQDAEIIVFGDNLNDLSLFEVADRSYAVSNALPELKERATGVLDAHTEDALAKFIESDR